MDNVAEWICEVDRGHLYPYKGNYSTYLETKAKRMADPGQPRTPSSPSALKNELDWVRSSPKARQAKNKARLERYDQMEAEATQQQEARLLRDSDSGRPAPGLRPCSKPTTSTRPSASRVLIDDLSFTLPRNGIVGVIGPNGVGKSTLFKTIVGLEPLTSRRAEDRRHRQNQLRRPEP